MPKLLTLYDMIILQDYFAKKKKPTADDKARAKKIDEQLCKIADGLVFYECQPSKL